MILWLTFHFKTIPMYIQPMCEIWASRRLSTWSGKFFRTTSPCRPENDDSLFKIEKMEKSRSFGQSPLEFKNTDFSGHWSFGIVAPKILRIKPHDIWPTETSQKLPKINQNHLMSGAANCAILCQSPAIFVPETCSNLGENAGSRIHKDCPWWKIPCPSCCTWPIYSVICGA